jgi:ABC-2 type transport system permease protein
MSAVNPRWAAVRAGLARGGIELRQTFTNADSLVPTVIMTAAFLLVMVLTRSTTVPGTSFSLGVTMLPSILGASVGVNGLAAMGGLLAAEREDGTLLRAKATPNGMIGYLVGKVVAVSGVTLSGTAATLITGLILFRGLALDSVTAWLTLIWVLALGLAAALPLGAVLGSLMPSARSAGLITLGTGGITAVSGIFYPITHLPHWLQWVGQAFPLYWLGLGMRSALLPPNLAAVEIGHSWRHLAAAGALGGWAIVGLTVAPVLLRRMARRESGSAVAARREKVLLRMGSL